MRFSLTKPEAYPLTDLIAVLKEALNLRDQRLIIKIAVVKLMAYSSFEEQPQTSDMAQIKLRLKSWLFDLLTAPDEWLFIFSRRRSDGRLTLKRCQVNGRRLELEEAGC